MIPAEEFQAFEAFERCATAPVGVRLLFGIQAPFFDDGSIKGEIHWGEDGVCCGNPQDLFAGRRVRSTVKEKRWTSVHLP